MWHLRDTTNGFLACCGANDDRRPGLVSRAVIRSHFAQYFWHRANPYDCRIRANSHFCSDSFCSDSLRAVGLYANGRSTRHAVCLQHV